MRAAPTPSARKAIPVSPIPASTTAMRKEPRRRAISRRGGTVSTKMTRNPSARRKTTTPYRPAAARSWRAAISRPMAALAIILWRALQHMPNVDGFAPSEILHLPPSEPSRPDGTDFALVPHRNFVAGPDLARRVSDSDREDVAHREEALDLDPIDVLPGHEFAPRQGQGKHAARGVHRELLPSSEHPDIGKTASERRSFDEAQSGVAELEAGDVRHLLREARTFRHVPDGTRHLIQRPGQGDERILRGRMVLRAEDSLGRGLVYDRCFRPEVRDHGVVAVRRQEGREVFDHDRGLVAAPVPRDGDVIIPRGVEAFQLPRDESQGRGNDDLVGDGRVRTREDRVPEPTVAPARRVGLARGTGEEE